MLLGAGTVLLRKKKEEDLDEELSQIVETTDAKSWDMPVLDGTSEAEDLGFDLSRFPGWSAEQVQNTSILVGLKTNLQSGISNKLRKYRVRLTREC